MQKIGVMTIKILQFDESLINIDKCRTPEEDRVHYTEAMDYFKELIRKEPVECTIMLNLDRNDIS